MAQMTWGPDGHVEPRPQGGTTRSLRGKQRRQEVARPRLKVEADPYLRSNPADARRDRREGEGELHTASIQGRLILASPPSEVVGASSDVEAADSLTAPHIDKPTPEDLQDIAGHLQTSAPAADMLQRYWVPVRSFDTRSCGEVTLGLVLRGRLLPREKT